MSDEKTVTILGRGPSWEHCPFEGEIWGAGSLLVTPELCDKRFDKVFILDNITSKVGLRRADNKVGEILVVAKRRDIPVISALPYGCERYPLLEIFHEFGITYLRNSISYMIAFAIYKGYKTIHLYGVDQDEKLDIQGMPYVYGKAHVTFWLGIAHERGIKFTVANGRFPRQMDSEMWDIIDKIYKSPKTKAEYEEALCRQR